MATSYASTGHFALLFPLMQPVDSRCIRSSGHNAGHAIFLAEIVHIALDCPHG